MPITLDDLLADPSAAFLPAMWATTQPGSRAARLRERLAGVTRRIDVERTRITTTSYQCTAGQSTAQRRAAMLLDLAQHTTLTIEDDELIVGNRTPLPRMGVIAPEGAVDWVDRELDGLATRPQDRFEIDPAEIAELRSLFPAWRGRTLEDAVGQRLPHSVKAAIAGRAFTLNQTDHAQGHILPDVAAWLRLGINGLRTRLATAAARASDSGHRTFYAAGQTALDAASLFISRYAGLADQLTAVTEDDSARRDELTGIARRCRWLTTHPARDFSEALQALWFLFVLLQMESNASSFSPGRLDQLLWPYLATDLAAGRLTLPTAQEWLECLWLKFNEIVLLRSSASARYFAGFPIGFNVVVGGQTANSHDATNALSYMCLRAQADLGLTQPNLSLRIHRGSPVALLTAATQVISRGSGMPQVFNDEVIVPGQTARGVAEVDALDYAVVGCVELSIPGKALGWSDAAMFNMTRVLELTLFGGHDPQTGARIGLRTPSLDQMATFAELEAAYDRQMAHFVDLMLEGCAIVDRLHAELLPSPFLSLVVADCTERGLDVTTGGARYNFSGVQGVQIANVADTLAAVEQAVFIERWLAASDLLAALRADFTGQEALRQRLLRRLPKYGNDDDRVDIHAQRWARRYGELVSRRATVRGGVYQPGFYTVSAHLPMGAAVGATADGRRVSEPLADGGLSPMAGRDSRGATAVLRSVAKLDLSQASNGALLNMRFLPAFFAGPGALAAFVQFLRTFSQLKIPHIQFNVVSAETLRQAQAQPDLFRSLVVRVAGYSAYFTELDQELQEEIVARTAFAGVE